MSRLSGTATLGGDAVEGVPVAVIDTDNSSDPSNWSLAATTTTDANGEWEVTGLEDNAEERYHAISQYDDGEELYNVFSKPFLSTNAFFEAGVSSWSWNQPQASIVAESVIPDSGISRFEFEDDSDTSVLVDSWSDNDGTLSGGSYVTDGVSFDGTDDYGELPNAILPVGSGEWSIAIRFETTGGDREAIWGARDTDDRDEQILIEHRSDDELEITRFDDGTGGNISTGETGLRDGNEHLIVLTEDGSGAEVFKDDGTSIGSDSTDLTHGLNDDWGVGYRGGSGGEDRYYEGTVYDLRTYDKALSSSEVSNLWNEGSIEG